GRQVGGGEGGLVVLVGGRHAAGADGGHHADPEDGAATGHAAVALLHHPVPATHGADGVGGRVPLLSLRSGRRRRAVLDRWGGAPRLGGVWRVGLGGGGGARDRAHTEVGVLAGGEGGGRLGGRPV